MCLSGASTSSASAATNTDVVLPPPPDLVPVASVGTAPAPFHDHVPFCLIRLFQRTQTARGYKPAYHRSLGPFPIFCSSFTILVSPLSLSYFSPNRSSVQHSLSAVTCQRPAWPRIPLFPFPAVHISCPLLSGPPQGSLTLSSSASVSVFCRSSVLCPSVMTSTTLRAFFTRSPLPSLKTCSRTTRSPPDVFVFSVEKSGGDAGHMHTHTTHTHTHTHTLTLTHTHSLTHSLTD